MVPCLHCGYLDIWLISSKHFYFENLSYSKKQQKQAEAQTKQYHQKQSTVKACFNFLVAEGFSLCVPPNPVQYSQYVQTEYTSEGRKKYNMDTKDTALKTAPSVAPAKPAPAP